MKARVFNVGPNDLHETFKGEEIKIPAGGFIDMEFFEAHEYKGQFAPIYKDAGGLHDPKSFKMLKIEKLEDGEVAPVMSAHKCMSCGKTYESEPVLKAHAATEHADQATVEIPELDESIKKRGKKPAA